MTRQSIRQPAQGQGQWATASPGPQRRWRSYGTDPLPTGQDALDKSFLCGKEWMFPKTHAAQGDMLIRTILDRMRYDGCGGRAGKC
jgi:hypothetical protein